MNPKQTRKVNLATDQDWTVDVLGVNKFKVDTTGGNALAMFPLTSDGGALGSVSLMWSDTFLADGGVINWNNGNYTITHSAGKLTTNGQVIAGGAVQSKQGTDIASASTIVIPTDGNIFELTGTTAVTLITTTGYQDGFEITLIANENVTITHGTATSGADVTIKLAGSGDFAMTADDTLKLVLSTTTAGGQAWREVSRTAI